MNTKITLLLSVACLLLMGCAQEGLPQEEQLNARCNSQAKNLTDYAECRCKGLTGAKSYNDKMDACMTNKNLYAKGYTGPEEP